MAGRIARRKKGKKVGFKIFIFVSLFIVCAILFMASPFFETTSITISPLTQYTDAEIMQMVDLNKGMNIFTFNYMKAKKTLLENAYIKSVDFQIKLPGSIIVEVTERTPKGYVPFMGTYLYIDEKGRVLESATSSVSGLPELVGLDFDSFRVGEILEVTNQRTFDVVVTMAQMMMKYDYVKDILKIDASDILNIHLYIRDVDVNIGDISDCDKKMRFLLEIMENELDESYRGTLDLRNPDLGALFQAFR